MGSWWWWKELEAKGWAQRQAVWRRLEEDGIGEAEEETPPSPSLRPHPPPPELAALLVPVASNTTVSAGPLA